jgi:hypothetical protein
VLYAKPTLLNLQCIEAREPQPRRSIGQRGRGGTSWGGECFPRMD